MAGANPKELELITTSEVARLFGITTTSVYQWTVNGCPCQIKNGKYMFLLKDILAWKKGKL